MTEPNPISLRDDLGFKQQAWGSRSPQYVAWRAELLERREAEFNDETNTPDERFEAAMIGRRTASGTGAAATAVRDERGDIIAGAGYLQRVRRSHEGALDYCTLAAAAAVLRRRPAKYERNHIACRSDMLSSPAACALG